MCALLERAFYRYYHFVVLKAYIVIRLHVCACVVCVCVRVCAGAHVYVRACVSIRQSVCEQQFRQLESGLQKRPVGPVLISDKTSYCAVSQSVEVTIFVFKIVRSLWNLTGTSAALLQRCLSNFKAMRLFEPPIMRLRKFTRSQDKTSNRILKRGPGRNPGHIKIKWNRFRIRYYCTGCMYHMYRWTNIP